MPDEKALQIPQNSMFKNLMQIENSSPEDALGMLLDGLVTQTSAGSGRLYCFNFATSKLSLLNQVGRTDMPPDLDMFDLVESTRTKSRSLDDLSALEQVVVTNQQQCLADQDAMVNSKWHKSGASSRLLVPIEREGLCIGVIDIDSNAPEHFTPTHVALCELVSVISSLILDKKEALHLLRTMQQPINFHLDSEAFMEELMTLAATATQMPYVALRELSDDQTRLECIGSYGFGDLHHSELDLQPVDDYPTFLDAIASSETQVEPTFDAEHLKWLRSRTELSRMRSFMVTPVLVGTDIFGTLSVALEREYTYTSLERRGLEMVANAIGVAISNQRNANHHEVNLFDLAKHAGALAAVEVAQAVRHEARGHVSNASIAATLLEKFCTQKNRVDGQDVLKRVKDIQDDLKGVSTSLDKIRQITKPPKSELKQVSLTEMWEKAFEIVRGRLAAFRIQHRVEGSDVVIEGYPDYLVQGFLNLILNSIDAFKDLRRKQNRSITVYIEKTSPDDTHVNMRCIDTATGIDPSMLPLKEDGSLCPISDIFKPGVTTKGEEGSGYGLYLVRRALAAHNGSIDITDWRRGTSFMLSLPKVQR